MCPICFASGVPVMPLNLSLGWLSNKNHILFFPLSFGWKDALIWGCCSKKRGRCGNFSAGCCLPAPSFIFPSATSFTVTLQALLLNSHPYFFTFQREGQNNRQPDNILCVFVAKSTRKNWQQSWECQKNPTNSYLGRGAMVKSFQTV